MQAERDYLAKVVFPELKDRMSKHQLHLVDLDLRWGVTEEEAEHGKVLEMCLQTIDRSRPFFIGLLGERYGSLPGKVPEDTQRAFPWLPEYSGYSLTSLEIVHGVLRNPELAKRSFFYFRDPQLANQIPESKRTDFLAESPEAACKLAALKEKIRSTGAPLTENYPCRWNEQGSKVVGLETFGQKVLEDLWTAIREEYPAEALEVDPVVVERQMHEAFVEERSHLHVGRVEQAARLTHFAQGDDRRPAVITGESGCGKSAFLANWYRQYAAEHPDDFVLAYFVGASPDSTNHYRLLRNMCKELKRKFALEEELPQEDKKLSEVFAQMLTSVTATGSSSAWEQLSSNSHKQARVKRAIVLLDALDQLSPLEAAHGLGWLLDYVPRNVRLVVSSLEGECLDVLRRRGAEEIVLPPLSLDEQQQIIRALLGTWGRKLDNRQTAALLAHPEARNPLYLRVALEELRLFGEFEKLTQRIDDLAPSIIELFDQVLARLEEDHGHEFVAETFNLLGCSRYGLSEVELLDLLSSQEAGRLPRVLWTRLMFSAKMYLVQRGELFGFFHRQFADAVRTRYPRKGDVHVELAKYFEHSPVERKIDEYPFQLQRIELWQALADALSDLDLFDYAWKHNREYEWVGYWLSLKECFQADNYYRIALEAKVKAEGESQNVASVSNEIGLFLADMALYNSAKPFYERALRICESALGPNHPNVAVSLNNLAGLYRAQGRYDDALPLYQRALKILESALGPNHPNVAVSLNNLALLYRTQGRYDDALPLYARAPSAEVPGNIVDNVHFSITSPAQVCPSASFVVDIWAHLGEQRDEVIRRAKEALPNVEISIMSKGPVNVCRGTILTVRLKIDELEVEDYEDTIMWNAEIGNANFRVTVPKETAPGSKPGVATIHANGIQIARIYFDIQVGNETSSTEKIQTKQQQNRKAFASYASADRDSVLARIQGIQKIAPQLEVFVDVVSLRSGQYWEKELWEVIPSKDVFYLFWSSNAAKSEWVEKEWRCALKTRGLDFIDPVPLEAPEQAPPPPELSSKHFNDWTLPYMRGKRQ
jgi:tetratricopeptide (TPR) repeat protein